MPPLLHELGPPGLGVFLWDAGSSIAGCWGGAAAGGRIPTIVAGRGARGGARDASPVDTFGVLATIEDALRLPRLGAAADSANGSLRPLLSARLPLR